jgi:long-chain fatty acid transport protein
MPGSVWDRRFAVSVGLFVPAERVSRIRALPQRQPHFSLYDNRPQRIVITTSLGVELLDDLYLGAGVTYLSNTEGTLDIRGLVSLQNEEQSALFSSVDVDLSSVRYPSAGLLWTPGDHWRVGVGYREEFDLRLDLDVRVRGDVALNVRPGAPVRPIVEDGYFSLTTENSNLFAPRQLALGVTYEADRWMLTGDLTWHQWSRFPAPVSTITIDLNIGNIVTNDDVPPTDKPLDPGFHDIVVSRIGGEYDLVRGSTLDLTLRAGLSYEPSPAPDQPGATNYVDCDKLGLGAGFGINAHDWTTVFPKPVLIDVAFQYIRLLDRDYDKANPADPVGDYRASGDILGGSVSASFLF